MLKRGRPKGSTGIKRGEGKRLRCVDCCAELKYGGERCQACRIKHAKSVAASHWTCTCDGCGKSYLNKRRSYVEGTKYCSRECAFADKAAAPPFSPLYEHVCKQCSTVFVGRGNVKYCSDECRRVGSAEWYVTNAERLREEMAKRTPDVAHNCKECGARFTSSYGDLNRKVFCSDSCSKTHDLKGLKQPNVRAAHRRLRKQRLRGPDIAPVTIFERDNWCCRICGEPVERDACVPHHHAPTIDHVVPLALGGPHAETNVQCAHFICNVRKAAKFLSQ